ncbi:sulfatase-like hydrolase/transferase [Campylobacter sp. JMF_02 ED1]|uniref:sulfatase-like hydrolase/transferase n=1 Tax=unclassified Campylobacter TaxID=2593542 RepID=UPI0022EA03E4|nr:MULTISPECIES: sulfatase-like hydrolase/transferase [unclassified Campylobacter]MDA3048920.1 sulfatase-like hydrolase/transferase [Campylobacter sp. JMF_15 NE4]MDA3050369.1 sulfatase-like hydrolase/transferase [Campylobacter sp. JMF_02 ED1]
MTYISVFCFIVSLFLAKFLHKKWLLGVACALCFVYILFLVFDTILLIYLGKHFGFYVVVFVKTSIIGAPISTFARELIILSCVVIGIVLFCVILYQKISPNLSKNFKLAFLFILFLITAFLTNPLYINAKEFYEIYNPPVAKFKKITYPYLKVPHSKTPKIRKNIVYIYLESYNRDYLNSQVFPNLTPYLSNLDNKIDFTNITQVVDTEFTLKGLFGSHCGINYTYVFDKDKTDKNFSENIKCGSEILKEQGYYLYFMKGADLEFQDTRNFLKHRKYDEMKGKTELLQDGEKSLNAWGVNDDDMLEVAWNDFVRLSKEKDNFLQTLLTISTHAPDGFLSKTCENLPFVSQDGMLRAVQCTDYLVGKFIDKIRLSEFSKNTIIILQNDHPLPYSNSGSVETNPKNSKNIFMILDDSINGTITIDKKGTSFDSFTTVLGYLGILDEMNFGRNLLKVDSMPFENNDEIYQKASRILTEISYDEIENKISH